MSEADYMAFLRERQQRKGPLADKVEVSLADEKGLLLPSDPRISLAR